MNNNNNGTTVIDKIVFLVIIIGREKKEDVINALSVLGVRFMNTMYCKGTFKSVALQSALGLVPEKNKVMITTASTYSKASAILDMLNKKFNFDKPDTGIAFTMPINRVVF